MRTLPWMMVGVGAVAFTVGVALASMGIGVQDPPGRGGPPVVAPIALGGVVFVVGLTSLVRTGPVLRLRDDLQTARPEALFLIVHRTARLAASLSALGLPGPPARPGLPSTMVLAVGPWGFELWRPRHPVPLASIPWDQIRGVQADFRSTVGNLRNTLRIAATAPDGEDVEVVLVERPDRLVFVPPLSLWPVDAVAEEILAQRP